ncbi:hypothetical protein HK099_001637, partial [Clydaea vesicula]
ALVNGVFLLALCFTLLIQAIQRFVVPEEIDNPKLVLIVGAIGLLLNIVGMSFFHDHGSHFHDHSHHSHDNFMKNSNVKTVEHSADDEKTDKKKQSNEVEVDIEIGDTIKVDDVPHKHVHTGSLNMRGVFLHFLGDALGSVAVLISALINLFVNQEKHYWVIYIDPITSLFITFILIGSAWPLVSSTLSILLQNAPDHLNIDQMKGDILKISKVVNVHEFHVWQISETKAVASVHVLIKAPDHNTTITSEIFSINDTLEEVVFAIQKLLHSYGVHNTTVQPEFLKIVAIPENEIEPSSPVNV